MNLKKILPVLLLLVMAVAAFGIRSCNRRSVSNSTSYTQSRRYSPVNNNNNTASANGDERGRGLDRDPGRLFYTKHARCRMQCRHITQQEVKDILVNGTINYNKSDLADSRGLKYAVEGNTSDGQHVRIIFAPNSQHTSVVTVIDLEEDFACSCD